MTDNRVKQGTAFFRVYNERLTKLVYVKYTRWTYVVLCRLASLLIALLIDEIAALTCSLVPY